MNDAITLTFPQWIVSVLIALSGGVFGGIKIAGGMLKAEFSRVKDEIVKTNLVLGIVQTAASDLHHQVGILITNQTNDRERIVRAERIQEEAIKKDTKLIEVLTKILDKLDK